MAKIISFYRYGNSKNVYVIDVDELDPFSDNIQLYASKNDNDCIISDDGYTNYNFICWGQRLTSKNNNDEIVVSGKWSDINDLIDKELNLIRKAYKKLKPIEN